MKGKRHKVQSLLGLLLLCLLLLLLIPGLQAAAADGGSGADGDPYIHNAKDKYLSEADPSAHNEDGEIFPGYPSQGGVGIDKTARWVTDEIAQVDLTVSGIPMHTPVDVVLVLDTSGSMGNGSSNDYSPCTNPAHYTTYSYTKELTYSVRTGTNSWHNNVSSMVTVELRVHKRSNTTFLSGYTVSGYYTEYKGAAVTAYRSGTGGSTWGDWHNTANARSYLTSANGMRGVTSSPSGYPFPTTASALAPSRSSSTYNASQGCTFRINSAKEAGLEFMQTLFAPYVNGDASENRLAVVSFSTSAAAAQSSGRYLLDAQQEQASNVLRSFINGRSASNNTNYTVALNQVITILNTRTAEEIAERPVYVVFMSDGQPNQGTEGINNNYTLSNRLKNDYGATIYTVGLSVLGTGAPGILTTISSDGRYYPVIDDTAALVDTFTEIAGEMRIAATEAVIEDIISDYYTYYEGPGYQPSITPEGAAQVLQKPTVGQEGGTWRWEMGDVLKDTVTFTYYLKLDTATYYDDTFDTNVYANITYRNYQDDWCRMYFPIPELPNPGGSIQYYYYEVDADGYPLSPLGARLDNTPEQIRQYGHKFNGEFGQYVLNANGQPYLPLNVLYPVPAAAELNVGGALYQRTVDSIGGFTIVNEQFGVTPTLAERVYTFYIPYQRVPAETYKITFWQDDYHTQIGGVIGSPLQLDSKLTEEMIVADFGADWRNLYQPVGYQDGVPDPPQTDGFYLTIAQGQDNEIKVLYKARQDLTVTVEYYLDDFTGQPFQHKLHPEQTFGSTFVLSEAEQRLYLGTEETRGYDLDSTDPANATITVAVEGNLIQVLYTKSAQTLTVLHQYYDSSGETLEYSAEPITSQQTFGAEIRAELLPRDHYSFRDYTLSSEPATARSDAPFTGTMPDGDLTITFVYLRQTADLTVVKDWQGGSNHQPVTVQLYRHLDENPEGDTLGDPVTISGPSWSHTYEGLVCGYRYTVEEVDVPAGYSASYTPEQGLPLTQGAANTLTVTNTRQQGQLTIEKYLGGEDKDLVFSFEVTLTGLDGQTSLQLSDATRDNAALTIAEGQPFTVHASVNTPAVLTGLYTGTSYSVREIDLPRDYRLLYINSVPVGQLGDNPQAEGQISGSGSTASFSNLYLNGGEDPQIEAEKLADKHVYTVGETVLYTITFRNNGDLPLTGIEVDDDLLGWNSGTDTSHDFNGVLEPGQTVVFSALSASELSAYAGGECLLFPDIEGLRYTVKAGDGGLIRNEATITYEGDGSYPVENTVQVAAIEVTKSADKSNYFINQTVQYTITVRNSGGVTLNDVSVNDPQLRWSEEIGTLEPGDSVTFSSGLTYQTNVGESSFTNTATASGAYEGGMVTDQDDWTVNVVWPALGNLGIMKTVNAASGAPERELSYVFELTLYLQGYLRPNSESEEYAEAFAEANRLRDIYDDLWDIYQAELEVWNEDEENQKAYDEALAAFQQAKEDALSDEVREKAQKAFDDSLIEQEQQNREEAATAYEETYNAAENSYKRAYAEELIQEAQDYLDILHDPDNNPDDPPDFDALFNDLSLQAQALVNAALTAYQQELDEWQSIIQEQIEEAYHYATEDLGLEDEAAEEWCERAERAVRAEAEEAAQNARNGALEAEADDFAEQAWLADDEARAAAEEAAQTKKDEILGLFDPEDPKAEALAEQARQAVIDAAQQQALTDFEAQPVVQTWLNLEELRREAEAAKGAYDQEYKRVYDELNRDLNNVIDLLIPDDAEEIESGHDDRMVFRFSLKHDGYAEFANIPAGTEYELAEIGYLSGSGSLVRFEDGEWPSQQRLLVNGVDSNGGTIPASGTGSVADYHNYYRSLTVTKSFQNLPAGISRPNSVEVQLYQQGERADEWRAVAGMTATLNAANNWRYTFRDLADGVYRVEELNVPQNFTARYGSPVQINGDDWVLHGEFLITNVYEESTTPPPGGGGEEGGGGGGGGGNDRDRGRDTTPTTPTTQIEEEPTPLASAPGSDAIPESPTPEPLIEIEEPAVPLAAVPQTGDDGYRPYLILTLLCCIGLLALALVGKSNKA